LTLTFVIHISTSGLELENNRKQPAQDMLTGIYISCCIVACAITLFGVPQFPENENTLLHPRLFNQPNKYTPPSCIHVV
jgi:hypothetical protein